MEADEPAVQASGDGESIEVSERTIAHRLDALEAERVFHRALELEAEAVDQPHMFTGEQLESIAKEVNMDVAFVRTALGEVRLSPRERSRLERFILPDHIMETETIEGLTLDQVNNLVETWMKEYEGLIEVVRLSDGVEWDIDRSFAARIRTAMISGGNRISRTAGGDVVHRIHSISDDEQVVAMQSKGEAPLLLAKTGFVLAAAVFVAGTFAAIGLELVPFIQTMAGLAVGSAVIAGGAVIGARRWAKRVGRALRRSLTSLAQSTKARPRRSRRLPWRRQ